MNRLDIKPLSVNEAWQGRRFKTDRYKGYWKRVTLALRQIKVPSGPKKITLEFGFSSKASDVDNPVKPFLDILCKKYRFDDREIYEMVLKKKIVPKGSEYIAWEIEKMEI